jgi:hypothetical protein
MPDESFSDAQLREWAAMEDRDVPLAGALGHRAWALATNQRNALARRLLALEAEGESSSSLGVTPGVHVPHFVTGMTVIPANPGTGAA